MILILHSFMSPLYLIVAILFLFSMKFSQYTDLILNPHFQSPSDRLYVLFLWRSVCCTDDAGLVIPEHSGMNF